MKNVLTKPILDIKIIINKSIDLKMIVPATFFSKISFRDKS